jgi:hypothetical protein
MRVAACAGRDCDDDGGDAEVAPVSNAYARQIHAANRPTHVIDLTSGASRSQAAQNSTWSSLLRAADEHAPATGVHRNEPAVNGRGRHRRCVSGGRR